MSGSSSVSGSRPEQGGSSSVSGDRFSLPDAPVRQVSCSLDDGCITCGDVAVPLTVVSLDADDARCQDEQGREELVATDLVGEVVVGDRLLVHAGVALEHLDRTRKG